MTALITKFILFVGLFMGGFLVVTKIVPHKKLKTNNELGGYIYGIIGGSTFGHEITHGFDDQGSQYDETCQSPK
jgi:hypothetical protein